MKERDKEKIRKQMHRLLDIVLDGNGFEQRKTELTGRKPTLFANFNGHTNGVEIDIYETGWSMNNPGRRSLLDVYLEEPLEDSLIDKIEQAVIDANNYSETEALRSEIESREKAIGSEKEKLTALKKKLKRLEENEKSA